MKIKSLIAFVACVVVCALSYSCSNEENTTSSSQFTAFTSGIVTEVPMTRVRLGASEASTAASDILTRTSMVHATIGGKGSFSWEAGDVIYVQDDNNMFFRSQSNITSSTARHTFLVSGVYGAKASYDIYYNGTNSGLNPQKVTIAATQTQTAFNNTEHLGAVGDCGVAKATKNTDAGIGGYKFDLEHKASYLCFLPFIVQNAERSSFKIQKIEVTSNNNIAGTYNLSQEGLSGAGETKIITLNVGANGLPLADQDTENKSINNSLYMVIAPGTHTLSVKYIIFDSQSNKVITVTKKYTSLNFEANKVYDIPVGLGTVISYNYHHYMWDARENYWSGHEWNALNPWQPTENEIQNTNFPKSKWADGARWYNENDGIFEASNALFKKLPNANEMAWYVMKGDPHWDNETKWKAFGRINTGGVWIKKLSIIAQEQGKQLADLKEKNHVGLDMRSTRKPYSKRPVIGKPSASELSKYFFLPALGKYYDGKLTFFASKGYYWSSTACPNKSDDAYYLHVSDSRVFVGYYMRVEAFIAQPLE